VGAYLNAVEPIAARKDAKALHALFKATTNSKANLWGTSIVGYGEYKYSRANGEECSMLATGFSMRKSGPVLYIMPGYTDYKDILSSLGKYKLGKSCLYLKKLEDVDQEVLANLISLGIRDLKKKYKVKM